VIWLAGYTQPVDWVHSTAMDLYFWHAFLQSGASQTTTKRERAIEMLLLLFMLRIRVPYMFNELGFRVAIADDATQYSTFPDDYMVGNSPTKRWHSLYEEVEDYIAANLGTWPST